MNDTFWILPAALVAFLLLFGGIFMGTKIENTRIYDKCLTTNSSMVHDAVIKMCREIVK